MPSLKVWTDGKEVRRLYPQARMAGVRRPFEYRALDAELGCSALFLKAEDAFRRNRRQQSCQNPFYIICQFEEKSYWKHCPRIR